MFGASLGLTIGTGLEFRAVDLPKLWSFEVLNHVVLGLLHKL